MHFQKKKGTFPPYRLSKHFENTRSKSGVKCKAAENRRNSAGEKLKHRRRPHKKIGVTAMRKAQVLHRIPRSQELLRRNYAEFFLHLNRYMEQYKKNRENGELQTTNDPSLRKEVLENGVKK